MKAQQLQNRLTGLITGIRVSWSDNAPLDETSQIENVTVKHKLPVMNLAVAKLWREQNAAIVGQPLLWRIDIAIVFKDTDTIEHRRIVSLNRFSDIGHACDPVIEEAMSCGTDFLRADMTVECLGRRQPEESDYGDFQ